MASGTAAGQVVTFAFSPLITRIYSPETFGLQGIFLSLVSILSPAIALRYPMAIVVATTEEDAQRVALLSLIIAFTMSLLLGVVLLSSQEGVLVVLGAEALGSLIWFLPVALLFTALQDVANFRSARLSNFRLIGIVTVVQTFLANLARVVGGLLAPVAGVLVAITSVAPSVQAALLNIGNRGRLPPAPSLNRDKMLDLLRRHRDFPLYRMPTDVLNAMSLAVPVLLLAALYSPVAVGLYILSRSVLQIPTNLIGASVGNVLYPRYAELNRDGKPVSPLVLKSTIALAALAPVIIGAAWFAPYIFSFVFGAEWREAGIYARWMALWSAVALANIPAIRVAAVIKIQGRLLLAQGIILLVRIVTFWAAAKIGGNAEEAIAAFSIVSCIANMVLIFMILVSSLHFDRSQRIER